MHTLNRRLLTEMGLSAAVGPERILQIGEGNFLRAFVDWMVHRANEADIFDGSVVVVQPRDREQGAVATLNAQDGLYTVLVRGRRDGRIVDEADLVTVVSRGINPYRRWDDFLATAAQEQMRFVVSNTTEAGVTYEPTPRPTDAACASFPAKMAAWLFERHQRFGGAADKGVIFLPCELIDRNGDALKKIIRHHAADWKLGEDFDRWLDEHNFFLNTLVDRIVPGYPAEEIDAVTERLGYEDRLTTACEAYFIWVIEGPAHLQAELPLDKAGLNVVWTDDLTPYRYRKVRILNGAHMTLVPTAFLAGFDTVGESLADPVVGGFLRATLQEEILPTLDLPDEEKQAYAADTLDRFANPFIRHELLTISLNSIAKFPVRLLPTLLEYVEQRGKTPRRMALALAALLAFYRCGCIMDGLGRGARGGLPYTVNDSAEVLEFFVELWTEYGRTRDVEALCRKALGQEAFWGRDLNTVAGLAETVGQYLRAILAGHITQVMAQLQ